jgi:hypothetical protein
MKYKELQTWASECQLEADELAIKYLGIQTVLKLQSICDFNLMHLYDCSPEVVLHKKTLEFLADNIEKFKRKIKAKEIIVFDFAYIHGGAETFDDFKQIIKR